MADENKRQQKEKDAVVSRRTDCLTRKFEQGIGVDEGRFRPATKQC